MHYLFDEAVKLINKATIFVIIFDANYLSNY